MPGEVSQITAIDSAVWIAATSVLPESQRVVWPTKPWLSVPVTPARPAELVVVGVVVVPEGDVVVDGVTVFVVVLADGGTVNEARGDVAVSPPPNTSTDARMMATANSPTVAATSTTCVRPNRGLRAGGGVGRETGGGGGYGV
ncbi:hypothetical protein A5662_25435 [Mycobacteriaceae bacterium 1482268.1]|nr:hypothetical protein A5662_25435 [Mycobacteriaceae bacterium 1482268.1]